MRILLLTASAAALLAGPAMAQDWTGPYIGGVIGYGSTDNDDSESFNFDTNLDGRYGDTVNTTAPANAFSPGFCDGSATNTTPAAGCTDDDGEGVDFAFRAGYDWQTGSLVYGVVGEVGRADLNDSVSAFSTTPARYEFQRELNYTAALRLRLGYAADRFLVYGTAGGVYGDLDRAFVTSNGANSFTSRDDDGVYGIQYGAGVEYALTPQISLGAEYLRTSFEDNEYTVRSGPGPGTPMPFTNPFLLVNPQGTDIQRSNDRFDYGSLRLTAAYRF